MLSISKLPSLVRDKFRAAQKAGDLIFYQTQVSILKCNGLPFQVRYSPTLANKPKSNKPRDSKEKPLDPFSNPPKGLRITDLPHHILVLNKFPIIPDHFILATKEFKEQTQLLEEDDLQAAYACLRAYRDLGEKLFGFFNSGEHSGASQPHRHIQFLPVNSMRSGINGGLPWEVLADSLRETPEPELPFSYFSSSLPEDPTPQKLHETYMMLHNSACCTVQEFFAKSSTPQLESPISYNLGMTDRTMVLCARASEGVKIKTSYGEPIGPISLNGTILGGTLLVKSEAEWDALREDESNLQYVLSAIGFPPKTVEHDGML